MNVSPGAEQQTATPGVDPSDDFARGLARVRAELSTRPPFLRDTFEKFLRDLERRPKWFVELHGAQGLPPPDRRRLEPRLPQRLEAYALIAGALLMWTDLPSLRCGKLVAGERIMGLGQKYIAEVTGLSLQRIRRAIADLVVAGYVTWKQPIARYVKPGAPGGVGHAAWNAIYRLEVKFFEKLHRDQKLARQRRRAAERRANRVRIYAASLLRAREALRRARTHLSAPHRIVVNPVSRPPRNKP